jgi:hypothetical protein
MHAPEKEGGTRDSRERSPKYEKSKPGVCTHQCKFRNASDKHLSQIEFK